MVTYSKIFCFLVVLTFGNLLQAKQYIIYSIDQEVPLKDDSPPMKKNYYINIGMAQGVTEGTLLTIHRTISKLDPYNDNRQFNYKIPIGFLKVIHVEQHAAIALISNKKQESKKEISHIHDPMIGDNVDIFVKK